LMELEGIRDCEGAASLGIADRPSAQDAAKQPRKLLQNRR
jgi:hypothetical protein